MDLKMMWRERSEKEYTLRYSTYRSKKCKLIQGDRNQISGCLGREWKEVLNAKEHEETWGVIKVIEVCYFDVMW